MKNNLKIKTWHKSYSKSRIMNYYNGLHYLCFRGEIESNWSFVTIYRMSQRFVGDAALLPQGSIDQLGSYVETSDHLVRSVQTKPI